ncbi:MAG: thioredoxin family protein [Planctomycetaceae bacterium]|nr:thioredoxin family protein [Planctomycetaceae bacterium]
MRHVSRPALLVLLFCMFGGAHARAGEITFDAMPFGDFAAQPLFPKQDDAALLSVTLTPETDDIAPGAPFKLLLTLNHAPSAYTYWTNPGGPGMATKIAWTLPEGFQISEPQWPLPQLYQNGGMTFYVHKGRESLVFTVTPPKMLGAGDDLEIQAHIDTQVCTPRSCNPLRLEAAAIVTASRTPGEKDPAVAPVLAELPQKPQSWRFEAADYDGEIVIGMYPQAGANDDPQDIYFFDANPKPIVDSQQPQRLEKDGGVWWLRLPRLPGPSRVGERLSGVIRAGNGWGTDAASSSSYRIDLPIGAEGAGRPPGLQRAVEQRAWVLLVFSFLGGLLLNVMPSVFPVIGLKIMGFAKQAHKERRAVFLHGLSYTSGVLICFWALSLLVITMGRGWGAQLQSDWFMFAMCHIFLMMSMNMAGVFEVGTGVAGAGQSLSGREGLKRSFFTGLLATLTSTPCSAPFLGTALAYALSLPPMLSLGVFTLMGLGFSFPYLALSLFPSWLKRLPKPGPWMDTFRQAMAFPLFATTAYLFWTMEAMMEEWHFLMLLFGLVMTAMACWFYGKYQRTHFKRPRAGKALYVLALGALGVGLWLGMPKTSSDLQWEEWSPEMVSRLLSEGRPVYVDFTARWCATCQLNKRVYSDNELRDLLQDKNVALLKADWTQYDERITSTLKNEFNKAAVPVTALYKPGERRADLLPDILTVENVGAALKGLP